MYKNKSGKIVATIEARMSSTRLPGKVLLPLAGKPVLVHIIERLKRSQYVDVVCLATSSNPKDEVLETLAQSLGIECFRGSEEDVLGRVLGAARSVAGDIIVEISGDCPAVDPHSVDRCIEEFFEQEVDYVANNLIPTYPTGGFEVQVFRTALLADIDQRTHEPVDRAHVTYYIYTHPEAYRMHNVPASAGATAPELRAVLDEESDYRALSNLFEALYPTIPEFTAEDVVSYLKTHPEIAMLNQGVRRKKPHEL